MHVAIDLEKLRVTHIHGNANVLNGLVYLEGAKIRRALLHNTDNPLFLCTLSSVELNKLYHNLTLKDFPPAFNELMRRDLLASVIARMQPQKVNEAELDTQIETVIDYLETPIEISVQFKYVQGSRKPCILKDGLPVVTTAPASEEMLATSVQSAAQRRSARSAVTVASPARARAQPRASAPRTPRAPGQTRGAIAKAIWEHADVAWEKAGKPTDKKVVLALRKEMMDYLEQQCSISRSTASVTLGDWMKERLK
jgi:hypothetical protein